MVHTIYVSKKREYASDDAFLLGDIVKNLGLCALTDLVSYNRYCVEGLDADTFDIAVKNVFSEPQVDTTHAHIDLEGCFAVELLPGQFDQRADSAQQCIQFITGGERPTVRYSKIYRLSGNLSKGDLAAIKSHIINPVESREGSLEIPKSLDLAQPVPDKTPVIDGFIKLPTKEFPAFIKDHGLAMDEADVACCQDYFKNQEHRDPTLTELKMIDTYWSDHCRHTTFMTQIDEITIEHVAVQASYHKYLDIKNQLYPQGGRPVTLMDLATIGAKYLKKTGVLKNLDESEEINACSVKINVNIDGKKEKWLLMFKNETHNHPTEIEPFGGAATCLGGAIRDPLSGRSYVYQAMRVTGAGNPLLPVSETMKGKLPQSKICQTAAAGYSSYGNQIGLATGHVAEVYHDGFVAKRMEVGAVIGAAPAKHVVRKQPEAGDVVILLGGSTGRDGCGGATGSSKAHDASSLERCGAEVQKGNAPEERKIQRLFRNGKVTRLIKRCNDFGAGGVSVAIGELADGLDINLDAVPKKYDGLSGTELAISESQERMAVVVAADDAPKLILEAEKENLNAVVVAKVTGKNRLEMYWQGDKIVSLCRNFLNSAGAVKHTKVSVASDGLTDDTCALPVKERWEQMIACRNVASQRGLVERFDATIGAGSVLMPFGGRRQLTPTQAMAALIPVLDGETDTCSVMAYGYDPYLATQSPYYGAYYAVISSVAKMLAAGGDLKKAWLSFQEYFERLRTAPERWGKPFAALLGGLEAQLALGLGAIGGKDSMSGSFETIDVPPTLISFVASVADAKTVISPEFKQAGNSLYLIEPVKDANGLYNPESLLDIYKKVQKAIAGKRIISAYAIGFGGIAEAVTKMAFGNKVGVSLKDISADELFQKKYGAFVVECSGRIGFGRKIGQTKARYNAYFEGESLSLDTLEALWSGTLEPVYKTTLGERVKKYEPITSSFKSWPSPAVKTAEPRVLIPVFPGTNCEYDTARAFELQGAKAEILVVKNLTPQNVEESAKRLAKAISKSNIVALPGGFSGGDEPDGSAKFIVSLLRNPLVAEEITKLLEQNDGLMLGICNGFQALVKLGLVPYGRIVAPDKNNPTLTYNAIGRHQSRLVHTRVASNKSPWLMHCKPGDIHTVAISHGEGRFIANKQILEQMLENGQVATQYVDLDGVPTSDLLFNPNNSVLAIESATSPDGRVFGKMAHSERIGPNLYKNVPGVQAQPIFKGAVDYFKK